MLTSTGQMLVRGWHSLPGGLPSDPNTVVPLPYPPVKDFAVGDVPAMLDLGVSGQRYRGSQVTSRT